MQCSPILSAILICALHTENFAQPYSTIMKPLFKFRISRFVDIIHRLVFKNGLS
jgi:hypothetical protein